MKTLKIIGLMITIFACLSYPGISKTKSGGLPFSLDTNVQKNSKSHQLFSSRSLSENQDIEYFVINFEGIGNNEPVGTVHGNVNVIFGSSWLGLVDNDAGGSGNFANEPSPDTTAYFLDQNDISIRFDAGVQLVEFNYTAAARSLPITVTAYDKDGKLVSRATGNTIGTSYDGANCSGDPNGDFCRWGKISLASTSNNIRYIEILGTTSNYFGIDNLKVGLKKCAPAGGREPVMMRIPITESCGPTGGKCLESRNFGGGMWDDCLISRIEANSGEKIELWCIAGSLPSSIAPGLAHYELHYFFPDGNHQIVGVCRFVSGRNLGILLHSGDKDGDGKPDCFIRTIWKNYDQMPGDDTDDDNDGMKDWWVFTYDVINNKRSIVNYESKDGEGGTQPDILVSRHDDGARRSGLETGIDDIFATLIDEFEANASPNDPPKRDFQYHPADLNKDGKVDWQDIKIFNAALGSYEGMPNFNSAADIDGDGCVTMVDRKLLFKTYLSHLLLLLND
ncbi:MAG: dockerin type I domain-containing protein [Desulfobaccales bacterium]